MNTPTILAIFLTICLAGAAESSAENHHGPDRGDGRYENPVMGGDYPDPSVVRVGEDFYLTHSSFEYYPGLLVWHSRDLVNWRPLCHALTDSVGSVWAPELVHHRNRYYIYFPAGGTNWVVTADRPEGPWSKPVDLKVRGIDPGHVVGPDGKRYLHLSDGFFVTLADDGLSVIGEPKRVYHGWRFPEEWNVECFCLESPKLTVRNGYYYLTVAQGGTAGPATSHMVASSRAKTPWGPWEHSPYNPIVHTRSKEERWWSRGHGTLVDDAAGNWWILYHAYEKGFHTLGRQMLMEPIEWTSDGWFRVPEGTDPARPIRKPAGDVVPSVLPLSDTFSGSRLGLQWQFFREYEPERLAFTPNGLVMRAEGKTPTDSTPLLCTPPDHAYEITVEAEISPGAVGGLLLFYSPETYCGVGVEKDGVITYMRGRPYVREANTVGTRVFLKVVNDSHEVSVYFSPDGRKWKKSDRSIDSSGYHHNTFGGFLSLRAGVFAGGEGTVTFRNFTFRALPTPGQE